MPCYMALIQGMLPKLLAVAVAFTLLQVLHEQELIIEGWWAGLWPVPFQMVLMMVVAGGLCWLVAAMGT